MVLINPLYSEPYTRFNCGFQYDIKTFLSLNSNPQYNPTSPYINRGSPWSCYCAGSPTHDCTLVGYAMGTSGLPDIYTLSPQALGVYIRQTTHAHGITIT